MSASCWFLEVTNMLPTVLRGFSSPSPASQLDALRNLEPGNFEERNLLTLLLYLGLSTSSLWKESNYEATPPPENQATTPPENRATPRPCCSRCKKTFSNVGNRNRHENYDCGQPAQFRCCNAGCTKFFTRKAYQDKHERRYCTQK